MKHCWVCQAHLEDVALFKTSALVHKLRFYISYLIEKNIMFDRHTYTLMQTVLMPVYSFLSANVSGINREEFVHLEVQIDGVFAMFKRSDEPTSHQHCIAERFDRI